jgi:hypothetical protein
MIIKVVAKEDRDMGKFSRQGNPHVKWKKQTKCRYEAIYVYELGYCEEKRKCSSNSV